MSKISGRWIKDGTDLNLNFGTIGITTSVGDTYQFRAASDGGLYLKDMTAGLDRLSVASNGNVHFVNDATISGGLQVLGTTTIVNAQSIVSDRIVLEHNTNDEAILIDNTSAGTAIRINNLSTGYALVTNQGNVGLGTAAPLYNLHIYGSNAAGGMTQYVVNAAVGTAAYSALGPINNLGHNMQLLSFSSNNSGTYGGRPNLNDVGMVYSSQTGGMLINQYAPASMYLATNNITRMTIDSTGNISYGGGNVSFGNGNVTFGTGNISYGNEQTFDGQITGLGVAGQYYHIGEITITAQGQTGIVHGYSVISSNTSSNVYHSNWVLKVNQQAAMGSLPVTAFWTVNESFPYVGFSTVAIIRQNDGSATKVDLYTYAPDAGASLYFDLSFFATGAATFVKESAAIAWDNAGTRITETSRETTSAISSDGDLRFNFILTDSQGSGAQGEGAGIVLADSVGSSGVFGLAGLKAYKADSTANAYSGQLHFQTRSNGFLAKTNMVLDHNGRLGIGSTQPDLQLNVSVGGAQSIAGVDTYSSSVGADTGSAIRFRRSNSNTQGVHGVTADAEELGKILFYGDTGVAYKNLGFIQSLQTGVTTSVGSQLLIATANNGGNPVVRMTIRETGAVGIATTVPLSTMHVQGTFQLGTSGTQVNNISSDVALGGGSASNSNLSTQLAIKSYVDGAAVWSRASGVLYPVTIGDSIGLGTTTALFGSIFYRLLAYGSSNDINSGLFSGAAGNYAGFRIGRTAEDGAFGISSVGNQWITGSIAGDLCVRNSNASGNKLLLSGDSGTTHMTILAGGNVGLNSNAPDQILNVAAGGAQSNVSIDTYNVTAGINQGSILRLRHSRTNTLGSSAATADGDELGRFGFYGSTGVAWTSQLAYISGVQTGVSTTIGGFINFATAGGGGAATEKMRLTQSGFLGVGSTTPIAQVDLLANNPTVRVKSTFSTGQGSILLSNDAVGGGSDVQTLTMGLSGTATGATSLFGLTIGSGPVAQLNATTGFGFGAPPLFIGTGNGPPNGTPITSSNGAIYFGTSGGTRMTIGYSGGVGIGSTQPELQMNIATGGAVSTIVGIDTYNSTSGLNTGSILRLRRSKNDTIGSISTTTDGDELGKLSFHGTPTGGFGANGHAYIQAVQSGVSTSAGANIYFGTAAGGGAPTTKLTITAGGRVGIGTTIPLAGLSVNGTTWLNGSVTLSKSTSQSSTYNIQTTDFVVLGNTSGGGFTMTLPAASSCAVGQLFIIKNTGTSNTLTVSRNATPGTDLIDFSSSVGVTTASNPTASVLRLWCDGSSTFWRM